MLIESLSGVEAADQYRAMFHVKQESPVFILKDQLISERYHCTTDRVEIESIKIKQSLNKSKVRVM